MENGKVQRFRRNASAKHIADNSTMIDSELDKRRRRAMPIEQALVSDVFISFEDDSYCNGTCLGTHLQELGTQHNVACQERDEKHNPVEQEIETVSKGVGDLESLLRENSNLKLPAENSFRNSETKKLDVSKSAIPRLNLKEKDESNDSMLSPNSASLYSPVQQNRSPKSLDPSSFYSIDYRTIQYVEEPDQHIVHSENEGRIQIDCATLGKLVQEMTSHSNYDNLIQHTFFLTFRNFIDGATVFKLLWDRFNIPPPQNCTNEEFAKFKIEMLDPIRLRVISSIRYWLENFYFFDFDNDEAMLKHLTDFIQMIENSGQSFSKIIERTLSKIQNGRKNVETPTKCPPIIKFKRPLLGKKSITILKYSKKEIARQLALIDFEMFSKIEAKECLNQSWLKESRSTKAPNIHRMTQRFNKLSLWIGSEIILANSHERRIKRIMNFLKIADYSLHLNNFNAVFSIMSGLASSPIHRLKRTWEALPHEYIELYHRLAVYLSGESNFKAIRQAIMEREPPSIPYVGIYLKDLTFIEEGSPKFLYKNGILMVNFAKCRQFAAVIRDIQTIQNQRYSFEVYDELRALLLDLHVIDEEEMYRLSLEIEPRIKKKKTGSGTENEETIGS